MKRWRMELGRVEDVLPEYPDNYFHGCFGDPPYGLQFMGKEWDHGVPGVVVWKKILRVMKPGAMLLAFGGTRTHHRLMCAIEDAGFEIRDCMMWLYGSGFPKSMDISKAIDRNSGLSEHGADFKRMLTAAVISSGKSRQRINDECGFTMRYDTPYNSDPIGWGCTFPSVKQWARIKSVLPIKGDWDAFVLGAKREVVSRQIRTNAPSGIVAAGRESTIVERAITVAATDAADLWSGYGTALKPAWEPIILAMKPCDGTFAENALKWGVAGLNIAGGRIGIGGDKIKGGCKGMTPLMDGGISTRSSVDQSVGRWPANLLLDETSAEMLDEQTGELTSGRLEPWHTDRGKIVNTYGAYAGRSIPPEGFGGDSGGASRFFYCAKASRKERGKDNHHPTVKPLNLNRYLSKLIMPPSPKARLLVPFAGSGSEMLGALQAGWPKVYGVECEEQYVEIAVRRLRKLCRQFEERLV